MTRVGFIGLGGQGAPIARRIAEEGFPLAIWARRPETLESFRDTAAIVAPTADHPPTLASLRDTCRNELAGYKLPRALIVVERVVRNEVGKVDYAWVRSVLAADDRDP